MMSCGLCLSIGRCCLSGDCLRGGLLVSLVAMDLWLLFDGAITGLCCFCGGGGCLFCYEKLGGIFLLLKRFFLCVRCSSFVKV